MLTKDYCSRILLSSDAHLFLPCSLVICVAFTTKIYSRNSSLHCTWGSDEERIWWKGGVLFFLIMDLDYEQCGCSQPHLDHPWKLLDYAWVQISMQVLSFYKYKIPCLKAVGRSKCSWLRAITRLWLHTAQILTYPLSQIFTFFLLFKWRGSFLYAVFFCFYLLTIFSLKAIDCRCLVLWSHLICDVSRRLSFWRPCGSKGL